MVGLLVAVVDILLKRIMRLTVLEGLVMVVMDYMVVVVQVLLIYITKLMNMAQKMDCQIQEVEVEVVNGMME